MLTPSYNEIVGKVSKHESMSVDMENRYVVIIAAAKRARQIIDGQDALVKGISIKKPVTISVNEMHQDKLIISKNV